MKLVGVGHSHLLAIRGAARRYPNELSDLGIELSTLRVGDEPYRDYRLRSPLHGLDGFSWSASVEEELVRQCADADLVFSCFGGNAHNVLGLVRHPRPYDFVLDEEPKRMVDEAAEIIPAALVENTLSRQGGFPETLWCLRALKRTCGGLLAHCESPPPVPSAAHLLQFAGVFKEKFQQCGVAPAALRYKLWRLHSRLIRRECESLGILFLDAPAQMMDADGYLAEPGWNQDATHGNAAYGMAVVRQLIQLSRGGAAVRGES